MEQGRITDLTEYPNSVRADCIPLDVAEGRCPAVTNPTSFSSLEHPDLTPFQDGSRTQLGPYT